MNDQGEDGPAGRYPPPPPGVLPPGKPGSWWRRATIPLVAAVVAAGTAGATVALLRDTPPAPSEPVAAVTPDPDPEPTPEPPPESEREVEVEPGELTVEQLAARYGPAVWKVETSGCGIDASGSAFAIDATTLITNWHVVVTDTGPTLVSRDGSTRLEGRVIGWSDQPDVAVIKVDQPVDRWMSFANASELSEGQPLVALGYPAPATDFTVTPSSILSFQVDGADRQAIRADGLLDKGNSGGPVLTTGGQVAGVVTELADNSSGLQLIPLAYTYDHLQDTIDRIIDTPAALEADCAAAGLRPELPDDWDAGQLPTSGPDDYGDDADLDDLWDACVTEDWDACDRLYWESPVGSAYESFGASCGDRDWWWGACAVFMPDDGPSPATSTTDDSPARNDPYDYGDDPELDGLWDRCATGTTAACDDLYWDSPPSSRYEDFGATCGDRGWAPGECTTSGSEGTSATPDPALTGMRTACEGGDWAACDELYWSSEVNSDDEDFGATCGGRDPWDGGGCVDRHG